MAPHTEYQVQSFYIGQWRVVFEASKEACRGYMCCIRNSWNPRLAYQLVRKHDGLVIDHMEAAEEADVGMIAGWPTAYQYERAAERALTKAAAIRAREAKEAARQ